MSQRDELDRIYGRYLTDPLEVLRRPVLNDVTDPFTAELVDAYAELSVFPIDAPDSTEGYRTALTRAWKAWRAADANATRLGASSFSAREQRDLERARQLLALALDPSASDPERRSAYKQAHKLLEPLVVLAPTTLLAIESRRAIESPLG